VIPVFDTVEAAISARDSAPRAPALAAPLRVHFWGSRGSLPTPLGVAGVRSKLHDALLAARGHKLETPEAVDAYRSRAAVFGAWHLWRQHRLRRDRHRQ
jgi:hypothetical protein